MQVLENYALLQKYMPIFGTMTERDSQKIQSTETYKYDATLRIFFRFGFFSGFTDID